MNISSQFEQKIRSVWNIFYLAIKRFFNIDGTQFAGAFAFNAFFSLFPLIILFVTIASVFIDQNLAEKEITAFIGNYIPISGAMKSYVFETITGVVKAREEMGAVALIILIWTSLQCFVTLVYATNHAWNTVNYNWWRLSLKSLTLLGTTAGTVILSMFIPVLTSMAKGWFFTANDSYPWFYNFGSYFIPLVVVFVSLNLFYKLAPRQSKKYSQVWKAALCATILLQIANSVFVVYLNNFATLNAVYGAFGGIMALLLWIFLSGCVFIFGACLCAIQTENRTISIGSSRANREET
jgi:Ca2+-transporting ATPase